MMLAIAEINRFGHLEVDVVNQRRRKKIVKSSGRRSGDSLIYIQSDYLVSDFIENYIPKNQRKSLNDGWLVKFRLSDDYLDFFLAE